MNCQRQPWPRLGDGQSRLTHRFALWLGGFWWKVRSTVKVSALSSIERLTGESRQEETAEMAGRRFQVEAVEGQTVGWRQPGHQLRFAQMLQQLRVFRPMLSMNFARSNGQSKGTAEFRACRGVGLQSPKRAKWWRRFDAVPFGDVGSPVQQQLTLSGEGQVACSGSPRLTESVMSSIVTCRHVERNSPDSSSATAEQVGWTEERGEFDRDMVDQHRAVLRWMISALNC